MRMMAETMEEAVMMFGVRMIMMTVGVMMEIMNDM